MLVFAFAVAVIAVAVSFPIHTQICHFDRRRCTCRRSGETRFSTDTARAPAAVAVVFLVIP
jgi:hypothetical protein